MCVDCEEGHVTHHRQQQQRVTAHVR
jgi:hypothetical protein